MRSKRNWILFGFVFLSIVAAWALMIPKALANKKAEAFAAPLYQHALPGDAVVVQKSAVKDKQGGTTAALILSTELEQQALYDLYDDQEYPPAAEGQTVELQVKPLDKASIEALKQAGLYTEGKTYWFIYLYSAPAS